MTVAFLTGGTGFVGGRLAALLRAEGRAVRALARSPAKADALRALGCELVAGDLEEPSAWTGALAGCEEVYHVGAWYELGVRDRDAARMERANVGGTEAVLAAATKHGARRIVYCGSVAALGPSETPADETHESDGRPRSHYERTKAEAHRIAEDYARRGAPVRNAMPATIYGPGDPSLVGLLLRGFVEGKVLALARPGLLMSLVHVEDVARGLRLAADLGRDGERYVLSESTISVGDWVRLMGDLTGVRRPLFTVPDALVRAGEPALAALAPLAGVRRELVREAIASGASVSWSYRGDKARRELGWKPRPLSEGLAETLEWFRARYAPRRRFRARA